MCGVGECQCGCMLRTGHSTVAVWVSDSSEDVDCYPPGCDTM